MVGSLSFSPEPGAVLRIFIDYKVRGSKCKHIFHIKYCRDILDLNGIPSLTTLVYRLNVIIY